MSDNPERHGVRTRSQLPTAQLVSTSVSIVDTSLSMFVPRKRGLYIIRGLATFFFLPSSADGEPRGFGDLRDWFRYTLWTCSMHAYIQATFFSPSFA